MASRPCSPALTALSLHIAHIGTITFSRSNLTVDWDDSYPNLLEFAEACDVPASYGCRHGVCHYCEPASSAATTPTAPNHSNDQPLTKCCCVAHDRPAK